MALAMNFHLDRINSDPKHKHPVCADCLNRDHLRWTDCFRWFKRQSALTKDGFAGWRPSVQGGDVEAFQRKIRTLGWHCHIMFLWQNSIFLLTCTNPDLNQPANWSIYYLGHWNWTDPEMKRISRVAYGRLKSALANSKHVQIGKYQGISFDL